MPNIAMWSGPRNISTAMMRSWDARPDTIVIDEPLYARYLKRTGADHPARDQIIATCQTDLDALIATLTTPLPRATGGLPTSASTPNATGDLPTSASTPGATGGLPTSASIPNATGDLPTSASTPGATGGLPTNKSATGGLPTSDWTPGATADSPTSASTPNATGDLSTNKGATGGLPTSDPTPSATGGLPTSASTPGATGGLPTSASASIAPDALQHPSPSNRKPHPTIFYQKHMAHHLLEDDDLGWILSLTNCLLIRDPAEMITSYIKVIQDPTPSTLALPQQQRLFQLIADHTGSPPPIIDARDVLENPRAMLRALCDALHVPFTDHMLSWRPGSRPTDGPWAPHWYANVHRSTGFAPYKPKDDPVPDHLRPVLDQCNDLYARLHAHRLRP